MAGTVGIGIQDFCKLRETKNFYVDKTAFIKEWWESGDDVTLITRPRRFGKTLTMSMVESFFSTKYAGRSDLFEGLYIWENRKYRDMQGTYPVIYLSFADVKEKSCKAAKEKICQLIVGLYRQYSFVKDSSALEEMDRRLFDAVSPDMSETVATMSIKQLSEFLFRHYGKKTIILLDEYDTPMQEAYLDGYWDEFVSFTRSLFNSTFKSNKWLERGIMTGITRVSKESVFSDLNNLEVVTTTSDKYADIFGFTEPEVFGAMDEMGLTDKEGVKWWYDGFTFGAVKDIYNPWSILNYLSKGKLTTYWADTSSNSLINMLVREASADIKKLFEVLLRGGIITTDIDEQLIYNQLDGSAETLWSLMLASGYLRVNKYTGYSRGRVDSRQEYELALTNHEVSVMFEKMIKGWFQSASGYGQFVEAMLADDVDAMNEYMNRISGDIFSSFDTGGRGSGHAEPERFYHGFVLGLMVELKDRYVITSNRESGFGRYDIMLKPRSANDNAIIIEFKVFSTRRDKSLDDTLKAALQQIKEKNYAAALVEEGFPGERIFGYGFAFEGKKVLIGRERHG